MYGIATSHPAFLGFTNALGYAPGTIVLSPLGAKALGAAVLTVLFALRVYFTHWARANGGGVKGGSSRKVKVG